MVFHLVNSDYRVTGTVAFQFKTFQRRQSERREWSLHLIPIGHLGLFVRVEWVGIVTDQFTMELFETLVLIISPITKLCSRVGLNSFPKQVPWFDWIKTLIQSSRKPQNGYQIVSNHVIVFTHMKVYIWGEYNPHKICLYTTDSCFIVLCASILYRPTHWWGVPPVLRLSSPLSHSYTAILCVVTQRPSPLREDTKKQLTAKSSNLS